MADNRFGKRIILLNKKKIRPSANVSSNEFLRKTVAMNVISLWKCREAVSQTTGATSHGNCHNFATKLLDVSLLIKHMTKDSFFHEQLGWTGLRSNLQQSTFPDLFADGTACLATGLELGGCVYVAHRNWDNYEPDNEVAADNEENDEEEMEKSSDDPYALYDMYD